MLHCAWAHGYTTTQGSCKENTFQFPSALSPFPPLCEFMEALWCMKTEGRRPRAQNESYHNLIWATYSPRLEMTAEIKAQCDLYGEMGWSHISGRDFYPACYNNNRADYLGNRGCFYYISQTWSLRSVSINFKLFACVSSFRSWYTEKLLGFSNYFDSEIFYCITTYHTVNERC